MMSTNLNNKVGATCGAVSDYPSETLRYPLGFSEVGAAQSL